MKAVGAILLLVAAALLFVYVNPDLAPDMTLGLVVAFVTVGIVAAIAGSDRVEGAPGKAMDPVRLAFGGLVLVAGTIATFMVFTNATVGFLLALMLLAGGGFLIYQRLNQPSTSNSRPDTAMGKMNQSFDLGFDSDLLDKKNSSRRRKNICTAPAAGYGLGKRRPTPRLPPISARRSAAFLVLNICSTGWRSSRVLPRRS